MLPDLQIGFSRGRSGGLVFPSLSQFSTVDCDPHSQRLWHVNKAEINVFLELSCFFHDPMDVGSLISGSSDLRFLYYFQLEHLEFFSSSTVEAWLGEF